jgi:RNA polymerase sigma-70 factor (ECF subfamily)
MPSQPPLSPASADPDLELVEAVRRGSGAAFDDLVRRHEARVVRLCGRILGDADEALDAAQEAFVKAWRGLPRFAGDARFSTWLTRIAINQCRNELRRRRTVKHQHLLSLDATRPDADGADVALVATLPASGPTPYEAARGHEVEAALAVALTELDDEAREVLLLRDAEHLSYDDIAEVLEVPIGTVRSRLHRARSDLHRRLAPTLAGGIVAESGAHAPGPAAPRAGQDASAAESREGAR